MQERIHRHGATEKIPSGTEQRPVARSHCYERDEKTTDNFRQKQTKGTKKKEKQP